MYVASTTGGPPRLFTRRLDQPKATELPGTTGANGPFFSPDGQWVGFVAGGKYNKISVEGGAVVPLAETCHSSGASWGQDGSIILGGELHTGLTRIPSGGGARTKVTDLVGGEFAAAIPQVLPGGKAVLFASYAALTADKARIDVVTLADGHRKTLVPGALRRVTWLRQTATGHLVYTNKGTLFAIPFDPERWRRMGRRSRFWTMSLTTALSGAAQFDVARNGTLVYRRREAAAPVRADATSSGSPKRQGKEGTAAGQARCLHVSTAITGRDTVGDDGHANRDRSRHCWSTICGGMR